MGRDYDLAQVNIARAVAPLDDAVMSGFVDQLEYINSVAERSPGFVWRLQTEDGDSTAIRAFEDPLIIVNMSVWASIEALYRYVFRSDHLGPVRDRRAWFQRVDRAHSVLWWVPNGHRPSLEEAKSRLEMLDRDGPGPLAFTFARAFDPDGNPVSRSSLIDRECGV
ncbi:MAG: DUF3291 domain-containing protein [Gemmatimonadota bacterium]|nr:DUF3291 domain-containing protein [Gemmatimonadota bacterium]